MPTQKSDRAGKAQMARRHREGRHKEPREGCPLCFPPAEPASSRLTAWAASAADQVVRRAIRARGAR